MKLTIDTDSGAILREQNGQRESVPLYSTEGFEILSDVWVKVGWNQRYSYTFTWMGRPIIQLPEDMVRTQEVLFRVRPDVIVETGVAHGGSLIYYASLLRNLGGGRVIGVDIRIHPENRAAIEGHDFAGDITLIEGDSVAPEIVEQVRAQIGPDERVLVILDSNHTRQHVADELEVYHPLVTPGSYIVATDGIMRDLTDVPLGQPDWDQDNPMVAAAEFAQRHPEFVLEQPGWLFNESELSRNITYWPGAWLRRI
jgi:cephalosporin hydroxylase